MAQETTKLIEELNEAKAKAESAWQSEHCLRLSAESERDAALGAVREIMKQRAEAEAAVARAETVRRLDELNMAREYRRGAEAMREACAQWFRAHDESFELTVDACHDVIVDMQIPEEP